MTKPQLTRIQQGAVGEIVSVSVGVMNVYEDSPGVIVATLSIHDPSTKREEDIKVKLGDVVTLGQARYRVVEVAAGSGQNRGHVALAAESP